MRQGRLKLVAVSASVALVAAALAWHTAVGRPARITVDYPPEGALFPPEFPPPQVEWRDASQQARVWTIAVTFGDDAAPSLSLTSRGEPPQIGEIDPRAVASTNELPQLTPERATAHTWRPDPETWDAIKKASTEKPAVLAITGYQDEKMRREVSRGRVSIRTSTDPVGAPIFYRDVPLMPSKGERGVIKPLDQKAVPLIAWRIRNVADTSSRVVMQGLHSCANCHSVSRDGKTMGMDLDGPRNDKGLYALFPIQQRMTIARENVIEWSTFRGKLGGKLRVAFMSQVSPDGQFIATTIADPGEGQTDYQRRSTPKDLLSSYYIANFTDYRFLQVFYPTRGILAWYSKATGILQALPGADDRRYVHTNATWSPDGSFLVFARAEAKDAYPPGQKPATYPNDPNENQIRYDLYRIPFNQGRGGEAVPIVGASNNGKSNSFPKISPDGRFVVFVQARNGQLMRPDGKLYIVPIEGGEARLMRANTPLMNSWHSFSPNGRWLVFSSKSRSPYTQMFLTHIDEDGNDVPAVLIENATAANRAVNVPEFVNVAPDGLQKIDAPVAEYFRLIDEASNAMNDGDHATGIRLLAEALAEQPGDPFVHNSYGAALAMSGRQPEAIAQFREAVTLSPDYPEAHNNLAASLMQTGRTEDAIVEFRKAIAARPDFTPAHAGLGDLLARSGRLDEAIPHLSKVVELDPANPAPRANLCLALSLADRPQEAIPHAQQAVALSGGSEPLILDLLGRLYAQAGRVAEAIEPTQQAIDVARAANDQATVGDLQRRLSAYQASLARSAQGR